MTKQQLQEELKKLREEVESLKYSLSDLVEEFKRMDSKRVSIYDGEFGLPADADIVDIKRAAYWRTRELDELKKLVSERTIKPISKEQLHDEVSKQIIELFQSVKFVTKVEKPQ